MLKLRGALGPSPRSGILFWNCWPSVAHCTKRAISTHQSQTLARRCFRAAERVGLNMRLTIVGSGDAFGSGGRFHTCFLVESAKGTLLVDCGATSLVALKAHGLDPNRIDGIVLSHLHGDHFGALPFLLLDAQFLAQRERPLLIAGPPGTRARLDAALEVFFPRSTANKWRFSWKVMEIEVGRETEVLGHSVTTTEVVHYSGAPSTALRLSDGKALFAYSGDTEWVDALVSVADGAESLHRRMLRLFRTYAGPPQLGGARAPVARSARPPDHADPHEPAHARPSRPGPRLRRARCRGRRGTRILSASPDAGGENR